MVSDTRYSPSLHSVSLRSVSLRSMSLPSAIILLRAVDTLLDLIHQKTGECYDLCEDCHEITNDFETCDWCCQMACGKCLNRKVIKCQDPECGRELCEECCKDNGDRVCALREDGSYSHIYSSGELIGV